MTPLALRLTKRQIDDFVVVPLRVLVIVVIAVVVRWLLGRMIRRVVASAAEGRVGQRLDRLADRASIDSGPLAAERRAQRARTVGSVLTSTTNVVVFAIALLTILGEVSINLAPIITGAGIIGVALGFGAQNVVKDYLAGLFMIVEDWYGVGDVIDVGAATGTVELVSLRVTRLRDGDGTVWHVRNGEVLRVGNKSQNFANAVIDLHVGWEADVDTVKALLQRVGDDVVDSPEWRGLALDRPVVTGIEQLDPSGVTLRLVVRTAPLKQWDVARALRERLKAALDEAGLVPAPPPT